MESGNEDQAPAVPPPQQATVLTETVLQRKIGVSVADGHCQELGSWITFFSISSRS